METHILPPGMLRMGNTPKVLWFRSKQRYRVELSAVVRRQQQQHQPAVYLPNPQMTFLWLTGCAGCVPMQCRLPPRGVYTNRCISLSVVLVEDFQKPAHGGGGGED